MTRTIVTRVLQIVPMMLIVGTLLFAMSVVPFLFLLAPGDRTEPKDNFDGG